MSAAENASNSHDERSPGAETPTNGAMTEARGVEELTAENARLREEIARLRVGLGDLARLEGVVERMERERAEIAAERDGYRKSLLALTWEEFTFTQEEIDDLDKNGVTLDEQFFEELERDMRAQESSDA